MLAGIKVPSFFPLSFVESPIISTVKAPEAFQLGQIDDGVTVVVPPPEVAGGLPPPVVVEGAAKLSNLKKRYTGAASGVGVPGAAAAVPVGTWIKFLSGLCL